MDLHGCLKHFPKDSTTVEGYRSYDQHNGLVRTIATGGKDAGNVNDSDQLNYGRCSLTPLLPLLPSRGPGAEILEGIQTMRRRTNKIIGERDPSMTSNIDGEWREEGKGNQHC